jgi:glucose/arabinose dehydrogenase
MRNSIWHRALICCLAMLLTACEPQIGPFAGQKPGQSDQGGVPGAPPVPEVPPGPMPDLALEEVAAGLAKPIGISHAGDGSGRLFIVEQAGLIKIWKEGNLLPQPFLDIRSIIQSRGGEQGLLAVAFHPRYRENGLFFVNYTALPAGATHVARYRVSRDNSDRADADSGVVLLRIDQPFSNHNGGDLKFGPDGYLYVSVGDGGSAGDPRGYAQNRESLLGKLLRIDIDAETYKVPPENPFVGQRGLGEIWAWGLRNPWRIAFDRRTGDLWIADVGQNKLEEINFQPASSRGGENYGWNVWEGTSRYREGEVAGAVPPVAEYGRDGGCSVTGGHLYRGTRIPSLVGAYLYGDYCTGKIWGLRREGEQWVNRLLAESGRMISSFGEDEAGEIYVADHRGGIFRLVGK